MELHIQNREITGSKTKKLRKKGIIPGVIYSKASSIGNEVVRNVQFDGREFNRIFKESGQTSLIELLDGNEQTSVLVYDIDIHPVNSEVLHVSFYSPNLKEKVSASVPLLFINEEENQLIKSGVAVLSPLMNEIEVEALPRELPDQFEIDIKLLEDLDSTYTVEDLNKVISDNVEVLSDSDTAIVKLAPKRQAKEEDEISDETGEEGDSDASDTGTADEESKSDDS